MSVVSKETVVLYRWDSEGRTSTVKDLESWRFELYSHPSECIRYDEGLTLETSAFQVFHGGNSTFINSFDKTKI